VQQKAKMLAPLSTTRIHQSGKKGDLMSSMIVFTPGLQWLVLADEGEKGYTNWGDGSQIDSSALVVKINSDQALNGGHGDWRMPTVDELLSAHGAQYSPKHGLYWTSSMVKNHVDYALCVDFECGDADGEYRHDRYCVRLVRNDQ
jgi:hypothetical protein